MSLIFSPGLRTALVHLFPNLGITRGFYRPFGLVEIDWEAQPAPQVMLRAIGVDGTSVFKHLINLEELREVRE